MADPIGRDGPHPGLSRELPQIEVLLDRYNLPEPARAFVRESLTTEPKRRVGGGSRNTRVRPMGYVIQCESPTVDRPFVLDGGPDGSTLRDDGAPSSQLVGGGGGRHG